MGRHNTFGGEMSGE